MNGHAQSVQNSVLCGERGRDRESEFGIIVSPAIPI